VSAHAGSDGLQDLTSLITLSGPPGVRTGKLSRLHYVFYTYTLGMRNGTDLDFAPGVINLDFALGLEALHINATSVTDQWHQAYTVCKSHAVSRQSRSC